MQQRQKRHLIPAFIATIVTIIGSAISGQQANELIPFDFFSQDKVLHLSCYMILTLLWCYGLRKLGSSKVTRNALLITIAIGVLMEIFQYLFFEGRQFEILDIIANISGSLIGAIIFNRIIK